MKSVAVLMSTYNGEAFLQTQIDSILAQEGVEVTLLVRDDGSNDATHAMLESYQSRGLLQWYTGKNLRSAYSFWDLVEHAPTADYYAFADQDDYWHPDKLISAVSMIDTVPEGPVLYFCKKRLVDGQLQPLNREDEYVRGVTLNYSLLTCRASGCTMVFNQSLMTLLQAYHPAVMTMHDAWVLRVAAATGKVLYDETPHMDYRQHGNNVVGGGMTRKDVWRKHFQSLGKHRNDTIRSQMAQQLYDNYQSLMQEPDRSYLHCFATLRTSFRSRMKLIFSNYIQTHEPGELLFVKLFFLLGWV